MLIFNEGIDPAGWGYTAGATRRRLRISNPLNVALAANTRHDIGMLVFADSHETVCTLNKIHSEQDVYVFTKRGYEFGVIGTALEEHHSGAACESGCLIIGTSGLIVRMYGYKRRTPSTFWVARDGQWKQIEKAEALGAEQAQY